MTAADSKLPLFLPQELFQSQNGQSVRRSSNGYLAPSPVAQSLVTPQNATSSAWRTSVCPFAPERRMVRPTASLEPTPTSSSVVGFVSPANLWPSMSPMGSPMSAVTGTSTTASTCDDRFAVRPAWPLGRRTSDVAAQLFAGEQSPFSADLTPIASTGDSATTRSRRSSDFEWLAPALDVPTVGSESPVATPMSCASSIGLNTARIFDTGSNVTTPTASYGTCAFTGMESKDMDAFFMQMPDNGPSLRMRGFGA
mmetsp:Transcript_37684/g.59601  ORF Transcript_37684/g.59601 Transcript_37684/m.59601 type:complete len:254 (+) Transcript_37684:62-823(+)